MKLSVQQLADGVPITMLIPLHARATETQQPNPMFQDPYAVQMVGQIDYNFSPFAADPSGQLGIAIRTEVLDEKTSAYIKAHPNAQIINLGAGLDTRFERLDNGQVHWVELDLPESIAVREHFLQPSERHLHLAHSALDHAWMTHPAIRTNRPTLVIAEGLFIYFSETQVKALLLAMAEHFPTGQALIEMVGQHMLTYPNQSVASTASAFQWGMDDPKQIETWDSRLHVIEDVSIYDRYPERWLALYPDLKKPLAQLRHKVTKITHLRWA